MFEVGGLIACTVVGLVVNNTGDFVGSMGSFGLSVFV